MKDMTKANVEAAFAGESQAHMKYAAFADMAEREKLPNVARASAPPHSPSKRTPPTICACSAASARPSPIWKRPMRARPSRSTKCILPTSRSLKMQEEKRAKGSMEDALAAEKVHQALYAKAKEAVAGGKDVEVGVVWVCSVCGFTGEGEPPEKCPVCGAVHTKLQKF